MKYWYLLPPYAGVMVANLGMWLRVHGENRNPWGVLVNVIIITGVFGVVWMLNEVYGVRYLQRQKRELEGMK